MKKQLIYLLPVFFILPFLAFAQEREDENDEFHRSETSVLIYGNIIGAESTEISNGVTISQEGSNNELTSIQQISGAIDYAVKATQIGDQNLGIVNQTGDGHKTFLLQNGDENMASLRSVGSNVQQSAMQEGDNNQINSYIENYSYNFRTSGILQLGDDNRVQLQLTDKGTVNSLSGISIQQNGPGNSVELSLDHFEARYLKVEQSGGAAASITHSDFYFPTH